MPPSALRSADECAHCGRSPYGFSTVQAVAISYAVGLPTVGGFGDVHKLVDLAVAAERHGWDGVHLWDHVLYHEPGWPVASPVVAAAAIAAATSRLRIILTVTLPRRQVQDVAQDTAGIDALSRRRLTVLATIGSMDREYSEYGLDADLRARVAPSTSACTASWNCGRSGRCRRYDLVRRTLAAQARAPKGGTLQRRHAHIHAPARRQCSDRAVHRGRIVRAPTRSRSHRHCTGGRHERSPTSPARRSVCPRRSDLVDRSARLVARRR